ncbi:quinoprotein amine dehydrogenase beta chain-like protein [Apiospora hydei]|uniref:Quinoprotein amine dehydrogenase beta chain-like protein n=1 Tax=Apiospora hydei TaxID=1337664 RepID=A0ABR1X3T9_9PEZI
MPANFTRFACLGLTLGSTMAATYPTAQGGASSLSLPYREVYQFSNDLNYIENIAVRQNGDLLVTLLAPAAQLHLIQDPHSDSPSVSLVHSFGDGVEGLLGIAETKPDTFLVAGSSLSGQPNASAVFEVDFNNNKAPATPSTRLVTNITEGLVLNGVAALPGRGHEVVLVADSFLGQVFRVDGRTGHYDVPIQVPEMKRDPQSNTSVGINGVKVHDGHLYFSNGFTVSIYRLKITPDGAAADGATVETVATIKGETFLDDFAIGADGTVWAASNKGHTVYAISPDGKAVVPVLGSADSTVVSGDTAAAFGRTEQDRHVLYVTASRPGKVVAIDTSKYRW